MATLSPTVQKRAMPRWLKSTLQWGVIGGVIAVAIALQGIILAFSTRAIVGGIGSVPGAMLGGLFLGVIESIGPILFLDGLGIPAPYQLKDAIAFVLLVLVLIFRPSGILGERLARKKA